MAQFFKRNGIKGVKNNPQYCPCGNFLRETFGEPIIVGNLWITDSKGNQVDVPTNVQNFVSRMDAGKYPDITVESPVNIEPLPW